MVGLKTFWITISALFMLAACVPQTKQTECKSNEAFNASLRTCVPVVGGPSSFININNYAPVSSSTRYKNDPTNLEFEISVANPYNQSYSISWERVFNGNPAVSMCSNAFTCAFPAALLGTVLGEVGTHVLIAKIKDGNGTTVDSHNFEIRIVDLPRPVINTASLTPASYAPGPFFPTDPRIQFSFQVKNNNASISFSDNYRIVWTVQKNGSAIYTESDAFGTTSPNGTNTAYLGNSPTPYFNPATMGVGSYIIRATVQNDVPGEVVAEQQWSFIIKQPDLANVTNISLPAPGVTITAHNDVDYNDFTGPYPAISWHYGASYTQPNFCVDIDDRDGTYPGDGASIQVRWYLDSVGGEICTKKTLDTPGTQTLCLVDTNPCLGSGLPFDTSLLKFTNTSPSVQQNHKVTARLFDEATSLEFDRADVIPSNGSYPIEWLVLVKPVNTAPQLSFGTIQPTGCTSAGASARSNCQVNQGSNFTVSFMTTDDFYSPSTNAGEFQWNLNLKYNGTDMVTADSAINTSCSKAFATSTTLPALFTSGYTTQWTCTVAVPHHVSTGPLNPSVGSYQAILTMQDSGSPVGGTSLPSQSLTWNLVVTETNTPALTLNPQTTLLADSNISQGGTAYNPADPLSYASETETINFMMNVNEPQGDDLRYRISLCTDNTTACTSTNTITSPAFISFMRALQVDPDEFPTVQLAFPYTIPQNLLIGMHATPIDVGTAPGDVALVHFKVDVEDIPSIPLTVATPASQIFSIHIRNVNPPPVINTATAVPAVGSTTVVQSGYPMTINPGIITDDSDNAAEKDLEYQWFSRIGAGAWAPVTATPQTTPILRYTPGNTTSTVELRLCVGDGTVANQPVITGACSASWFVTPKPYLHNLSATGAGNIQNEVAVWYDDTNTVPNTLVIYSAYVDDNSDIFVEKTIKDTNGDFIVSTQTIEFSALPGGTSPLVTNLSITGSDNSIYVAYIASSSSTPSTMIPRIRRIDKSFNLTAPAQAKTAMAHPAPFGFNYTGISVACSNAAACNPAPSTDNGIGGFASITFAARLSTGDTITINGEVFTAAATPTGANQVCDTSSCASINSMAQNVRDKINNSTLPSMHGITARANGGVVEIYSSYSLDYLDFNGTITGVPGLVVASGGQGRIVIQDGRWHLPIINASLGGTEQNNITVLSGIIDVHMRSGTIALNTGDNLTEMGKVAAFDNRLNQNGEMVFARISADISDAGALTLYRYSLSGTDWSIFDTVGGVANDRNEQDIFGAYTFEYVKLAADQVANPYYYVIAKEKSSVGGEWHMGKYNNQLLSTYTAPEYFLTSRASTADLTEDVIVDSLNVYPNTDSLIQFPDIVSVPGFNEARIFFHSIGTGTVPFPRLVRWKADNTLTCGSCFSLNGSLDYQASARIGISQVASDITLGSPGADQGLPAPGDEENINDVVFVLMSSDVDPTAGTSFKPQLGVINVDAEAIQSTTVDAAGKFQPPFVLD